MVDKRISDYITTQIKNGYNIDVIRTALIQQGQNSTDVDECIKSISKPPPFSANADTVNMSDAQYQGFWKRFVALFLDGIILGIPAAILQLGVVWLTGIASLQYVIALVFALLMIYLEGSKGGTPGKLILSIRIVNEKGEYIGFANALLRYFGKFISGIILGIGYFMIGWDEKKQGLHDKIAKTYVVKV